MSFVDGEVVGSHLLSFGPSAMYGRMSKEVGGDVAHVLGLRVRRFGSGCRSVRFCFTGRRWPYCLLWRDGVRWVVGEGVCVVLSFGFGFGRMRGFAVLSFSVVQGVYIVYARIYHLIYRFRLLVSLSSSPLTLTSISVPVLPPLSLLLSGSIRSFFPPLPLSLSERQTTLYACKNEHRDVMLTVSRI